MSWNSSLPVVATTGAVVILGGCLAWKVNTESSKLEKNKEKDLVEVVHLIEVEDLAPLIHSEDDKVKKAAELFLIQRASRQDHLTYILHMLVNDDIKNIVKAATTIYLLAKSSDDNKVKLLNAKAITILPQTIGKISNDFDYKELISKSRKDPDVEKILLRCIGSIFQLTLHDNHTTLTFSNESSCIRNIFLNILGDHSYHISVDVKRWVTFVIHQLSQCDLHPIKKSLRNWGIIRKATFCVMKTCSDTLQTQLCLQILVQYLNDSVEEIVQVCQEMATLNLLPHLVGLLRCDEEENIIHLSAVIMHHFCCFDMEIIRLGAIPGIVKTLFTVLNNTDASIQKTILRICNYLVVGSTKFRKQMLSYEPIIKKLSICLASGNSDVVYGSLMLIHDLAMPGKLAVLKLIQANPEIVKSLVTLSLSSSGEIVQLIAETLGFICSCESLHSLILRHNVVTAILHFARSGDVAVQFWASALLLNLSMISEEVKETIIRSGGVNILLEMAVSGDEVELPDIATNATKTLVILGFIDAMIDVQLVSGDDGSIIIDGTEHCPGKTGINYVSLDFINYKYSKGYVIRPDNFQSFISHHFESMKSDPIFAITQGPCTIFSSDEEIPSSLQRYNKNDDGNFLISPSWCLILTQSMVKEVKCGVGNLKMISQIPIKDFISIVLKENFTDPLIDVLLSTPPSSTHSKAEELELIEILARHSYQRKSIVTTAGFLEYLNELIWIVSSLKPNKLSDPDNFTNVSHCIVALKILHACSIDKSLTKELASRGLLDALQALLLSIIPTIISKESGNIVKNNMKVLHKEQKPAWFDFTETLKEDQSLEKDLADEFSTAALTGDNDMSYLGQSDTNITDSNDDLFQVEQDDAFPVPPTSESRPRTVTYAENVEYINEDRSEGSPNTPQTQSRMRADSFILRSDSRNIHLETYRSQSVLDQSINIEGNLSRESSPTRTAAGRPISADHQQMRRISRSMSISLQQAKSDEIVSDLVNLSDVIKQLVKHSAIIIYHMVHYADEWSLHQIFSSSILQLLHDILGCLTGTFRKRIGLAISASISHAFTAIHKEHMEEPEDVCVQLCASPRSCIISANQLEVSNENWFFETVCGNQAVGQTLYEETQETPAGWYYEVVVLTDGILQVGWANENCKFNPEKGIGVGDNYNSYGYDGARCKIWNGPSRDVIQINDYGIEWQAGDVISVLLSWDGILSFWLNGKDLGAAKVTIDTELLWYPAVSLSIDQHCVFQFKESSLRHSRPVGYLTLNEVYSQFKNKVDVLPKSKLKKNTIADVLETPGNADFIAFYYEVKINEYCHSEFVDIGYIRVKDVDSEESIKGDDTIMSSGYSKIYLTQCVSNTLLKDDSERKVNIIGCGISLPANEFFITKDGVHVFKWKMADDFEDLNATEDYLVDLIPYVSFKYCDINFGQHDFVYEDANSSLRKQSNLAHFSSLLSKKDGES